MKAGRPTLFTEEIANTILCELVNGKSLRKICAADDMPDKGTVFRWLEKNADFATRYARARELQAEANAEEIIDIADDEPDPQRARVRIDARKWVAAKLLPKKYGDKQTVQHEGGDTAIKMQTEVTDIEAARRIAFLLHEAGKAKDT